MTRKQKTYMYIIIFLIGCIISVIQFIKDMEEPYEEKDQEKQYQEERPEKEEKEVKKKEEKKKLSEFDKFTLIHWPFYKENECGGVKNCCNKLKGDTGGYTCYGVAINSNHKFYKKLDRLKQEGVHPDIKHYAKLQIYSKYYIKPKIDQLNCDWRQPVFDFTVNSGKSRAIKALQKIFKLKADGHIGPNTVLKSRENSKYQAYNSARQKFIHGLKIYKLYPKGLDNRIKKVRRQTNEAIKLYSRYGC